MKTNEKTKLKLSRESLKKLSPLRPHELRLVAGGSIICSGFRGSCGVGE